MAQNTEVQTNIDGKFHRAITLYNNKAYSGAQRIFKEVSANTTKHNLQTDADYYDAMCAIKLNQTEADSKVLDFVKKHPYSSKKEKIYLNIGNYYFANRKASHSLKWYQKVNPTLLNVEEKKELNYKMGYTLLVSNYLKDAKEKFATLLGDPRYGTDARYFYGYISYKQENYGEAEDNLSQLADNETYKAEANYYLLDMAFKSGKFEKAVQVGEKILPNIKKQQQRSDVSKIIGESYFNLEQYEKAVPYLNKYEGKNGKWTNTDYYYLGYSYYKLQDYTSAIGQFNKIIGGENKVAQSAYYHLAQCYLSEGKKSEALNAFKNASEMNFDPIITADADLNYAKLSYEAGNPYKSVPQVLKEYLAKYPESPNTQEISGLLITSYLHQQDYQGAINYLKANQNPENNALAHEVSLYRGMQLFNEQKLNKSLPHFLIATKAVNDTIKNKAHYWLGETNYLIGNYRNAVTSFSAVSAPNFEEAEMLNYNIAYAYFKQKDYKNSRQYFYEFLNQNLEDNDFNDDASNRLGDSFYASKQYGEAISAYDKVINEGGSGADYAQYQKAMSNGLAGDSKAKVNDLHNLIKNYDSSNLKDDALFQLATTYTSLGKTKQANISYNKLLEEHPQSGYIPTVELRQGLLEYNSGNNTKALEKFKSVVAKYPNSNEAKQAVASARNVYIDLGKVNEYATWVKTLDFVNVSNSDIDNTTYEAAENKYLENNEIRAIKGFTGYLQSFPNGLHALKANFYLGQLYFKGSQKQDAVPYYKYVIDKGVNEFSEEALAKLSQLYLEKEKWNTAMLLLVRLEKEGNIDQNIIFAQSNLMKGYYEKKDYEKAVTYAEKVLANSKIDEVVGDDARIILARSAMATNDLVVAEDYYSTLDDTATGELKAETLYYKAFFLHEEKAYESSNEEVQNLIANYSTYKYWGVKSYIIMAKNYYALKDAYQATYILDNIVKNFTQYKDLIEEAKNELNKIKSKEAKTNESISSKK
ncbi:tetratricopeptide repeat protein [Tenacibaculum agarivorans]|uniref:tetratricopeptide repeat protein n=1 Tax=Tenacibaculum agarivorans TaxID=1908389 RepID=UPI0009FAAEFF|nr:tetratricopeptide repeat protein [Tenacibaculum agarivorans]